MTVTMTRIRGANLVVNVSFGTRKAYLDRYEYPWNIANRSAHSLWTKCEIYGELAVEYPSRKFNDGFPNRI